MLYERTALSRQPDELVKQELAVLRSRGDVTPAMLLKDPYILDFLGLSDRFLERDLEERAARDPARPWTGRCSIYELHIDNDAQPGDDFELAAGFLNDGGSGS
jgi:hypothetical protein